MVHLYPLPRSRPWPRRLTAGVTTMLLCVALGASTATARTCWQAPVDGIVVDPFRAPPCVWCAGNRGLDYRVGAGAAVQAAASGRVEFAGTVVGVDYVVVRLPSGWRHTYGQLTSTSVEVGDAVLAGVAIGSASQTFFFSVRVGDTYVDPAPYIGELRSRPRLIPLDGTPARPAPPARPRCAGPAPASTPTPRSLTGPER